MDEGKIPRKMPWMKWYSRDALGDPKLRACEPASRGIWYDMLWLMDVNENRGYLTEDDRTLCRVLGVMPDELQQAKADLLANGVPSVDPETGKWYNRRMVRDDKSRKNGALGGNPKLIKKLDNQKQDTRSQKPDTRSQSGVEPENQPGVQPPVQPPDKKRFAPPSIEEVKLYCDERKNSVNAEQWHDHYSSNGWKVGKNPMRDWKAAVRTWERNSFDKPKTGQGDDYLKKYDKPWEGGLHG